MTTPVATLREIGPAGTMARVALGIAALVAAASQVVGARDAVVGLVAVPAAVTIVVALRGRDAPPLRAHGPIWHMLNITTGVVFFSVAPVAALLFYGVSLLVAATRGFGACELLAIPNLALRRADQLACPVLLPVDVAEARVSGRQLYCS